jgi:hypothetical protein
VGEPVLTIDSGGQFVFFGLLGVVTLGIAGIVFALLVSRSARRNQFRNLGVLSPRVALAIVAPVAIAALYFVYQPRWGRFYRLTPRDGPKLELQYLMPERTVTVASTDVAAVYFRSRTRRAGTGYSLVLETGDGRLYESQLTGGSGIDRALDVLEGELGLPVRR